MSARPISRESPSVRRTYLLEAVLGWRRESLDSAEKLAAGARQVLQWFEEKVPGYMTEAMRSLRSDTIDYHGLQQLTVIADTERGFWAGRLRYADRPRGNQLAVAGRTWTAEVVIRTQGNAVHVGVQMFMAARHGVDQTLQYDRPELIPMLEASLGLADITRLTPQAPEISSKALAALIDHPLRRRSVVVLTKPDRPEPGFPYLLDRTAIGSQLLGIAWVVCLSPDETYEWTEQVTRTWTVYGGAVRTYKPFLDWEDSEPFEHPLTFGDRIASWAYAGEQGESAFRSFLVEQCVRDLADMRHSLTPELTFESIQELDLRLRKEAADQGELLPLAEEEISTLRNKIVSLQSENETLRQDAEVSRELLDSERQTIQLLIAENQRYFELLKARSTLAEPAQGPLDYGDFKEWCDKSFPGRLQLHARAVRSLKDASYSNVSLVAQCLTALAQDGRAWLNGEPGAKQQFETRCGNIGVRLEKAGSETRMYEQDEAYLVEHPKGSGQKKLLLWKLAKGDDRDQRNCLRIYFFFDDSSRSVVVGHLTSHLPIRSSN